MRVLMVVGRSTGGIGLQAVDLTARLRAAGDEVTVATDESTADRFGLGDAKLWWPGREAGLRGSWSRLTHLRRAIRSADVVHAHGHQAGLVAALAGLGTRTPLVVSQHNAVLRAGGARGLASRLVQSVVARRAALVTGASSDLVGEAQRHGARTARLAPVPSPLVPELLRDEAPDATTRGERRRELLQDNGIHADPEAPLVLTIARIAPQKDLGTFVDLFARLSVPATGVVVGGGDRTLLDDLRSRVERDHLPVHFVGQQDDPARWLRAADAFVLVSTWEARALVVQEAMAAGVPVVATDAGGLRDLVDGVGALVPVGDAVAAAAAVETFLTDQAARHTAVVEGRARATSWDDGTATASRWREWYSDLLAMT
jgi:glycosyltransferase involved in cell wall biosynthesis